MHLELIPRPTRLPGRLGDWLDTFAESFLALVPPGERDRSRMRVEEALCGSAGAIPIGIWTVDYVRLRFAALKPSEAE